MTHENAYLDIKQLGPVRAVYPWDEWQKVPKGKMLDITDCFSDRSLVSGTYRMARAKGLIIRMRNKRAYVMQAEQ